MAFDVNNWAAKTREGLTGGGKKKRWSRPKQTAAQYAAEMKERKHLNGPKKGQELSKQEFIYRSGYMQARRDSAEMYKYKQRKQGK